MRFRFVAFSSCRRASRLRSDGHAHLSAVTPRCGYTVLKSMNGVGTDYFVPVHVLAFVITRLVPLKQDTRYQGDHVTSLI